MGISRRNPWGNFNWQYRMLRRKAVCCDVDQADCTVFPNIYLNQDIICRTKIPSPTNVTITVSDINPAFASSTYFIWQKNGLGGAVFNLSYGPSNYVITTGNQASIIANTNGIFKFGITAINAEGCKTELDYFVYVSNKPSISAIPTLPTNPCIVDSLQPSGYSSNGNILINNSNPDPNLTYYVYNITYGVGTPNPGFVQNSGPTVSTAWSWSNLCAGQYSINIELWRDDAFGVTFKICQSDDMIITI